MIHWSCSSSGSVQRVLFGSGKCVRLLVKEYYDYLRILPSYTYVDSDIGGNYARRLGIKSTVCVEQLFLLSASVFFFEDCLPPYWMTSYVSDTRLERFDRDTVLDGLCVSR